MKKSSHIKSAAFTMLMLLLFVLGMAAGGIGYFELLPSDRSCLTCHEMNTSHQRWQSSAHREVSCRKCHGGSADSWHVLTENIRRVFKHTTLTRLEKIALTEDQIIRVMGRCQQCHQKEYAYWLQGGHGANYRDIFLNEAHNIHECLADQCLQCHGMFYAGSINDLIAPIDIVGPWNFKEPAMADKPVIPCMACHELHAPGEPFKAAASIDQREKPPYKRDTLAFYFRPEKRHFALSDLPTKTIMDQNRVVKVSSDPRQRLCTQCHAPNAFGHLGSSDDKTPTGVHEGLSCTACHAPHSNDTSGSCAICHAERSSCGIDVTTMDTTYCFAGSQHDIHHITCNDCHTTRQQHDTP